MKYLKKISKKVLNLMLIGVLSVGLVGCGSSEESKEEPKVEQTQQVEDNNAELDKMMQLICNEMNAKDLDGTASWDSARKTITITQNNPGFTGEDLKIACQEMPEFKEALKITEEQYLHASQQVMDNGFEDVTIKHVISGISEPVMVIKDGQTVQKIWE